MTQVTLQTDCNSHFRSKSEFFCLVNACRGKKNSGNIRVQQRSSAQTSAVIASDATTFAASRCGSNPSRRSSPVRGQRAGRRLPAAAVADPGASRKSGHRRSSCLAHRSLLLHRPSFTATCKQGSAIQVVFSEGVGTSQKN